VGSWKISNIIGYECLTVKEKKMSDFKVVCEGGVSYPMSYEEKQRFAKKRSTSGRAYPFFIFDNKTELFMNKVIAIEVVDYEIPNRNVKNIVEELPKTFGVKEEKIESYKENQAEADLRQKEEEFIAKAECKHDDVSLFFHQTKKGKRYFPVCDFCGHRGRYVSKENLKTEETETAKEWVEK
jgi:uncharacterized glyoxalase superfamily protein PhnB